jgi:hypothetical protein
MKRIILLAGSLLGIAVLIALGEPPTLATGADMRSTLPPLALTGAPPEADCTDCHGDFALNSGNGSMTISAPATYTPGSTYPIGVSLQDPGLVRWGFELTALTSGGTRAGTLVSASLADTVRTASSGRMYASHTTSRGVDGTYAGTADGPVTWTMHWTAPAAGSGPVTFFACGVAADGAGTGGDYVYTQRFASSEAIVTPDRPPAPCRPRPRAPRARHSGSPSPRAIRTAMRSRPWAQPRFRAEPPSRRTRRGLPARSTGRRPRARPGPTTSRSRPRTR